MIKKLAIVIAIVLTPIFAFSWDTFGTFNDFGPTRAYQIWYDDYEGNFYKYSSPPTVQSALRELGASHAVVHSTFLKLDASNDPLTGDLDVGNNSLVVDTDTLVVNATGYEDRVGIGTAVPATKLEVLGDITAADIHLTDMVYGTPTYTSLHDLASVTQSAGLISGGIISDAGGGNINVTGGCGLAKTVDSEIGLTKFIDFDARNGIAIANDGNKYTIYVDYDATPQIKVTSTPSVDIDHTTKFSIGSCFYNGTDMHILNEAGTRLYNLAYRVHHRARELRGFEVATGGLVTSDGGSREIAVTSGVVYAGNNRITLSQIAAGSNITTWYYNGSAWVSGTATAVDNVYYNNIATGLESLGTKKYGVQWIYTDVDNHLHMVYGTLNGSLFQAQNSTRPSFVPPIISDFAVWIARVIIQQGDNEIVEIGTWESTAIGITTPTQHNELGTLAWTSCGHTGTASTFAGFDGTGSAAEYTESDYLLADGTRNGATTQAQTFDNEIIVGGTSSGQSLIDLGLVINESGEATANSDFRVETDNYSNALFIDASGDSADFAIPVTMTDNLVLDDANLEFSTGGGAADVKLYRSAENILKTDDNFQIALHAAIGADASVDSDLVLNIVENLSFVNENNTLMEFESTWTPSELLSETSRLFGLSIETYYDDAGAGYDHGAGRAGILYPFRSDAIITGTTTGNFYRESAYRGGSYNKGSGNLSIAEGFYGLIVNDSSEGNDTGDITNAYGARVEARNDKATGVIENYYGMYIGTPQGGGSFTNVYGLYVSDLAVAGVDNSYGIYFAGTGSGNGINWAGDTNLYRSTTNVLATDDSFKIGNILKLPGITSDPTSPDDGDIWYRSDLKEFRCRADGVSYKLMMTGI